MYEIQWFKIDTNIFSNRKIQIILKLSDGDTYFRVWVQLITLAVECNCNGRLEISENKPMTIQDFSKIMGKLYLSSENWSKLYLKNGPLFQIYKLIIYFLSMIKFPHICGLHLLIYPVCVLCMLIYLPLLL